jgi:hypothetical protein
MAEAETAPLSWSGYAPDEVMAMVLARAPEQTNGQLRAAVRRAVLRVDGEAAVRRRERKRRERGVVLYPEHDGMATLSATLPAAEAVGTFAVQTPPVWVAVSAAPRPS